VGHLSACVRLPPPTKPVEIVTVLTCPSCAALREQNERLREALTKLRRSHVYCEDTWYSCPKADEGCADDSQGEDCNCGADAANAIIAAALAEKP
jgi:hypothetical protein